MLQADETGGNEDPEAGGSAALAGFFYQAKVSVWVALDLLLRARSTDSVELEPANHEDICADLKDNDSAAVVGSSAVVASRKVHVQVKWRTGSMWTESSLNALLKAGKNRPSASRLLEATSASYLLITNAAVTGEARGNVVRRLGALPPVAGVAKGLLKGHKDPSVSRRIAISETIDEEKVALLIQRLLLETCKVPTRRWVACFEALYQEALSRMTRPLGRGWTRQEIEEVIKQHDGYLGLSAALELYVQPSNWAHMVSRLRQKNAVVLHGPSGTGKSITSLALAEQCRAEADGLEVRTVREAHQVDLHLPGPMLYIVDDPWGKNGFDAYTAAWNEELPQMLRNARENLRFIVTSRDDVMQAAGAMELFEKWEIAIERQQYAQGQWEEMFERRLRTLPRPLQSIAHAYRYLPLEKLATPFEMQVFFDEMRSIEPSKSAIENEESVERAIAASQRQTIELVIAGQMKQRDEELEAICIWGIFVAFKALTDDDLSVVVDALLVVRPGLYAKVEEVVTFLAAGHRLRQIGSSFDFHHPSVEAGLQRVVSNNVRTARSTIEDLLRALMSTHHPRLGASWGIAAAARLVVAARRVEKLRFTLPEELQSKVDSLLETQLVSSKGDLAETLRLLVDAGSTDTVPAQLARLLLERTTYNMFERPRAAILIEPEEAAALRVHPATRRVVERYIAEMLPVERGPFRDGLASALEALAGPTAQAYVDAAITCVKGGDYTDGMQDVYAEAVKDLDLSEKVLYVALEEAKSFKEWGDGDGVLNGHYNERYEEYYDQFAGERWHGIAAWLDWYVDELRMRRGWRTLAEKPYAMQVLDWWLRSASKEGSSSAGYPGDDEFRFLLDKCVGGEHEKRFWQMATCSWKEDAASALVDRLVSHCDDEELFQQAVRTLVQAAPHLFQVLRGRLAERDQLGQLVELFVAFDKVCDHPDDSAIQRGLESEEEREAKNRARSLARAMLNDWSGLFDATASELLGAVVAAPGAPRGLSDGSKAALVALPLRSNAGRLWKLETAVLHGCAGESDLREAIEAATSKVQAVRCVELAAEAAQWPVVESALAHPLAKAQAAAIKALSSRPGRTIPDAALALKSSQSRFVKAALLDAIEVHLGPAYLEDLVEMAKDEWEGDDPENETFFPFSRRAALLLAKLGGAVRPRVAELLVIAGATDDSVLRHRLIRLALQWGHESDLAAVLALCGQRRPLGLNMDASRLCVEFYKRFTPSLVASLSPEYIDEQPMYVASALVLLAGGNGPASAVKELAVALSRSPRRRVFLVLLALAAAERGTLRESVCSLLPVGHPCQGLFQPKPVLLERTALDDLGPPESVGLVLGWLGRRVEPKAPADEEFER